MGDLRVKEARPLDRLIHHVSVLEMNAAAGSVWLLSSGSPTAARIATLRAPLTLPFTAIAGASFGADCRRTRALTCSPTFTHRQIKSVRDLSLIGSVVQRGGARSTGKFDDARPWLERAVAEAEKGDLQTRV